MDIKDSSGKILLDGDTVMLTRTLKAKGVPKPMKQGTKIKNIRLTNNDYEVNCRINKTQMVIKTEYLKKIG
jgi:protein PhnA